VTRSITVDPDVCIGSANCEYWAPDTFEVGPDDKSHVIDADADDDETVARAAKNCPTMAIRVTFDG
jgi:ferredoxin